MFPALLKFALLASMLGADPESGPKAGDKIEGFKALSVTGKEDKDKKEVDFPADRKDELTVYTFVNADNFKDTDAKLSRPIHRFIRTLDGKLPAIGETVKGAAIWVGGDAAKNKDYLPKIKAYYENTTLAVFEGDNNGPKGWNVNSSVALTVVIAHKGKVVKSFAFDSLNEKDADAVEAAMKKAVEKK